MHPQIWGYEINKKLEWWNLRISLKIQPFTEPSLSSLHISLWGQACTELMEAFSWPFDIRIVWKCNQNHLRTFWNVASDDLKTTSEVKSQELMYFWPQKEAMTMELNGIDHSSCRDIILAWKIKQAFLHWTIKNIASFRYEAVEAVQGRQPKNWLSMHKSPLLRIPKMNSFYLAWNIILKKVGLKFDKLCLNTL